MNKDCAIILTVRGGEDADATGRRGMRRSLERLIVESIDIAQRRIAMILEETRMPGTTDMVWYIFMNDGDETEEPASSLARRVVCFLSRLKESPLPGFSTPFLVMDASLYSQREKTSDLFTLNTFGHLKSRHCHTATPRSLQLDRFSKSHLLGYLFIWYSTLMRRKSLRSIQFRMIQSFKGDFLSDWRRFGNIRKKGREFMSKADFLKKSVTFSEWNFYLSSERMNLRRAVDIISLKLNASIRSLHMLHSNFFSTWRILLSQKQIPAIYSEAFVTAERMERKQEDAKQRDMLVRRVVLPFILWACWTNQRTTLKRFEVKRSLCVRSRRLRRSFEALSWRQIVMQFDRVIENQAIISCLGFFTRWKLETTRAMRRELQVLETSSGSYVYLFCFFLRWMDETRRRRKTRTHFYNILRALLVAAGQEEHEDDAREVVSRTWEAWRRSRPTSWLSRAIDDTCGRRGREFDAQTFVLPPRLPVTAHASPTWNSWWDAVVER
eukprot:759889-Hanusia_phi.AAC.4